MSHTLETDDRQVVILRESDDFGACHLACGEPNRDCARFLDDVVVRDDVSSAVPNETSAALDVDAIRVRRRQVAGAFTGHDLNYRWRHALEKVNRRSLDVSKITAGLDGAWRRGRKKQSLYVRLCRQHN
jgi:hypothetical protein